jgi:hypothetical protein
MCEQAITLIYFYDKDEINDISDMKNMSVKGGVLESHLS